jgi:hypothetical protein
LGKNPPKSLEKIQPTKKQPNPFRTRFLTLVGAVNTLLLRDSQFSQDLKQKKKCL